MGASDERLDPSFQLGELERLREIVVGAEIQALHPIIEIGLSGEDQHGNGRAALTQAAQHLQTVHARQAEIEDHGIVRLGHQRMICTRAVVDAVDRIAALGERLAQPVGQLGIVFGEQNPHGLPPVKRARERYHDWAMPKAGFVGASPPALLLLIRAAARNNRA